MYFFVAIILGAAIIIGLLQKQNISKICTAVILIFLWIIMAANVDNPDYSNYKIAYDSMHDFKGIEWGYWLLSKACASIGMSYNQFKFVLAALGLFLIHQTAKKYLKNTVIFYALYFICPFLMDVTQLRNFISMAFFIFAVPFLNEKSIKGSVKYVIAIILGASFQSVALFYLPIVFLRKVDKATMTKIILPIILVISLLFGLNRSLISNIMTVLTDVLGSYDERIYDYAIVETRYGFLINWGIQIISFLLIIWVRNVYGQSNLLSSTQGSKLLSLNDEKNLKFIDIVETINIYAFIFLPLCVIESTYSRLLRNIVPLNFIVIILTCRKCIIGDKKITEKGLLTSLALVAYVLVIFYFWIDMNFHNEIVATIFSGNWFFNMDWSQWVK